MDCKGLEIHKWNGKVSIIKGDSEMAMQGSLQGRLYVLDCILAPDSLCKLDVASLLTMNNLSICGTGDLPIFTRMAYAT